MRALYKWMHEGERSLPQKWLMALTESSRIGQEYLLAQLLKRSFSGEDARFGHGVLVIPGFLGRDEFNQPLFNYLNSLGYKASGWMNGRNFGRSGVVLNRLQREVEFKFAETGQKITLVGHSLGGIYARELAKEMPEKIEQVITLGSPFSRAQSAGVMRSGVHRSRNASTETSTRGTQLNVAPPVPVTSVFTRSDCVIDWRSAVQSKGHARCENVEVYGSHCGLTLNAAVWYLLLNRLAQTSDNWTPFQSVGWMRAIYPTVADAT